MPKNQKTKVYGPEKYDDRDQAWVYRQVVAKALLLWDDIDACRDEAKLIDLIKAIKENPPDGCFRGDIDRFIVQLGEMNFRLMFPCRGDYMVFA